MQNFSFPEWDSPLAERIRLLFNRLPRPDRNLHPDSSTELVFISRANCIATRQILQELLSLIEENEFQSPQEEIRFFKDIKPLFSATLLYWHRRYKLELRVPVRGKGIIRKYWKAELHRLSRFLQQHLGFCGYLRTGETRLDEQYFLRSNRESENDPGFSDRNPRFTTAKDPKPLSSSSRWISATTIMSSTKSACVRKIAPACWIICGKKLFKKWMPSMSDNNEF